MLTVIQTTISPLVIKYLEDNKHKLVPDVSNYAKGRYRAWIGCEAPLTDSQPFRKAPFDYDDFLWAWLYEFCDVNLGFKPEIGLVHIGGANCGDPTEHPLDGRGGECGIKSHRDAGYADFRAAGINLIGGATFGYVASYPHQDRWSKEQNTKAQIEIVKMVPGTCVLFNCKNPHFAQVGPNRWCINAWRIRDKRRKEFEDARKGYKWFPNGS
jgi:hypothetical protein